MNGFSKELNQIANQFEYDDNRVRLVKVKQTSSFKTRCLVLEKNENLNQKPNKYVSNFAFVNVVPAMDEDDLETKVSVSKIGKC